MDLRAAVRLWPRIGMTGIEPKHIFCVVGAHKGNNALLSLLLFWLRVRKCMHGLYLAALPASLLLLMRPGAPLKFFLLASLFWHEDQEL